MASRVVVSRYAEEIIMERVASEAVYDRLLDCMRLLGDYPRMGREYDPEYPAARPPVSCRYLRVSDTPFTLYYTYDIERDVVTVITVEFTSGDPRRRFAGVH